MTQERKEEMRENEYKNKNEENNQPRENEENSRSKEYTRLLKRYVKNTKKITKTKTDFKKKFLYWHKFHFCDFDNFICSGCYCFSIKLWQIVFKE